MPTCFIKCAFFEGGCSKVMEKRWQKHLQLYFFLFKPWTWTKLKSQVLDLKYFNQVCEEWLRHYSSRTAFCWLSSLGNKGGSSVTLLYHHKSLAGWMFADGNLPSIIYQQSASASFNHEGDLFLTSRRISGGCRGVTPVQLYWSISCTG